MKINKKDLMALGKLIVFGLVAISLVAGLLYSGWQLIILIAYAIAHTVKSA
jgi:hypothetical protein